MVEHFAGADFCEDLIGGLTVQTPKSFVPPTCLDIGQVLEDFGRYVVGTGIEARPVPHLSGFSEVFHQ